MDDICNAFGTLSPRPWSLRCVNEFSDEPVANHPYAIKRGNGSEEHGVTDAAGFTHAVSSHLAETIQLFAE